jgi:cytochrome c oxidase cbb3-type subunit 3
MIAKVKRRETFVLCLVAIVLVSLGKAAQGADTPIGRALFLKNCAQCHGADARGDDGPDLHKLDATDEWITNRIRNGKAGQMTAFAGKLQTSEISTLLAYLRTLK